MDKLDRLKMMRAGLGFRHDLREDIREYILTPGLCTQGELARMLGMNACNFSAYLAGRIPLPYDRVERILWLLQGSCKIVKRSNFRAENRPGGLPDFLPDVVK